MLLKMKDYTFRLSAQAFEIIYLYIMVMTKNKISTNELEDNVRCLPGCSTVCCIVILFM